MNWMERHIMDPFAKSLNITLKFILNASLCLGTFTILAGTPAMAQDTITDELIANSDLNKGKKLYLRCRSCHTLGENEANRQGPNLWGLFDREAGTLEGFKYSTALQNADFTWSPDKLNEWLMAPNKFLPGNRMSFVGLPKEEDRVNLISYLWNETGAANILDEQAPEIDAEETEDEAEETSEPKTGTE